MARKRFGWNVASIRFSCRLLNLPADDEPHGRSRLPGTAGAEASKKHVRIGFSLP
jgi:hypothetical protein